jgi:diguanylate cyclase (GGDEF)-like protein/PAS domain S-box-containing protein
MGNSTTVTSTNAGVTPRAIMMIAGVLVSLLGILVMLGWHLHLVMLIQVSPEFVPMQFNTALGFLLGGVGILAVLSRNFKLSIACGIGILLLGLLTLFEYGTGINLGVDELFLDHYITTHTYHPGRMAPNTALSFILGGTSLLLASRDIWNRRNMLIANTLGSLILGIGLVAVFGYFVELERAYTWTKYTHMAIHTAAGFIMSGTGLIALSWFKGQSFKSNEKWLVPVIVVVMTVSFLLDTSLALGVASGIPYATLVLIGLWYPAGSLIIILAVIGSCLTLLGYVYSPDVGVFDWIVITNRMLALFVIWMTAFLCFRRKQTEAEFRMLSIAIEQSHNAIVITDPKGNIEYVNPRFTTITGYTQSDVLGKNPRILQSGETPVEIYEELWNTIIEGGIWHGELLNKKKNGDCYWASDIISPIMDGYGNITHFLATQHDVTEVHNLSEELSYQASHDVLTGLVNRREFERRMERVLSNIQQDKSEHALCFMDLDQFKVVNDTCGHTAGDELLRQISVVLDGTVRKRDTLARLGGDEFGLLMEHCSLDHAYRVANQLQQVTREFQFKWENRVFKIGVSIGLVPITEGVSNLSELLTHADAACYMAKDLGRNRIHVYQADDEELSKRRDEMQWVARLYKALEDDRFQLYAQSIIPLDETAPKRLHFELLLRLVDEQETLIPPGAFLPAAERYHLIAKLDAWVIKTAFNILRQHPQALKQIGLCSINLSGQSLADHDLLSFITEQLNEGTIEPQKICFEITETAAISHLDTASAFISSLKKLGCKFALDDFGSGLSSFGYLKTLDVDYLKIDGMFVKDIVKDPIDYATVKSINEIGQVMGKLTIAEFVEDEAIMDKLREIGVDYAQGYGIGRPRPLEEICETNVYPFRNANCL